MYFSDCFIPRTVFYELVWSKPTKQLVQLLGITDSKFSKICKKADIPRPSAWYWKKLEAGKKEPKIPLVPNDLTTQSLIPFESDKVATKLKNLLVTYENYIEFENIELLKERFEKRLSRITKKRIEYTHSEIRRLLAKDEKRRADIAKGYSWTKLLYDNNFEKRRIKIINSIANILSDFDGDISIQGENLNEFTAHLIDRYTSVTIDALDKKTNRENLSRNTPMMLEIKSNELPAHMKKLWRDSDEKRIEDFIPEIVLSIAYSAEINWRKRHIGIIEWKREQKERERLRILKQQAEARENTRRQLKAARQAHKDALIDDAKNLILASELRAYVKQVIAIKDPNGENEMMRRWARYVGLQADAIDPMKNGRLKSSIVHANKSRRVAGKNSSDRKP